MSVAIFSLVFALCAWMLISKISFLKNCGLSQIELYLLLGLKILVAVAFAFLVSNYAGAQDYLAYNNLGLREYQIMLTNPGLFFSDFGQNNYTTSGELFSAEQSAWDDLAGNIIAKTLAIFNTFTKGNFYFNSILFSSISFVGAIAFFRTAVMHGMSKKGAVIASFFLISTTVFTSAIHKDSFAFFALCMSCFHLGNWIKNGRRLSVCLLFLFLSLLFTMRNYIIICFIPAAFVYIISQKIKPLYAFALVCASMMLLIVAMQLLSPKKNLGTVLALRQSQFLSLKPGVSQIPVQPLDNSLTSVMIQLPIAMWNVAVSPLLVKKFQAVVLLTIVETLVYFCIVCFGFWAAFKTKQHPHLRLSIFMLMFSTFAFLIIGLIVPNAGAITRYRSIFLPFFLLPFIEQTYRYIKNKNI